ncbi:MAG TPA: (2Fe-2S)-binding protein [Planctomycetota bacterium]|nr:(2Fe-2S)-binding protein [Planctomycetota bacterium]
MSDPLVCRCYQVMQSEILDAIRAGDLRAVEEVTAATNAAGGCSSCFDDVQMLLDRVQGTNRTYRGRPEVPDAVKRGLIQDVLRDLIEPLYRLNGVQIQVLEVKGPKVSARYAGRTVGTTLPSILALKWFFVKSMSDACNERMQLVEVNMLDRGIAEDQP